MPPRAGFPFFLFLAADDPPQPRVPSRGPTGSYGAIQRGNLSSSELRITAKPSKDLTVLIGCRGIWLANERDPWITAGVRDASGAAGSHVGEQFELHVQWTLVPDSVKLEAGGAYLLAGSFQDDAPNGRGQDTRYGFCSVAWTF